MANSVQVTVCVDQDQNAVLNGDTLIVLSMNVWLPNNDNFTSTKHIIQASNSPDSNWITINIDPNNPNLAFDAPPVTFAPSDVANFKLIQSGNEVLVLEDLAPQNSSTPFFLNLLLDGKPIRHDPSILNDNP